MSFHIQQLVRKTKKTMGFVLRNSKDFLHQIQTMMTLYFAFVRSHLEFGMLIWDPTAVKYVQMIEGVQRKFLKFLYFKTFHHYPIDLSEQELLDGFQIQSLKQRRKFASISCLYDILRGLLSDDNLLQKIELHVRGSRTRSIYMLPALCKFRQCIN